MGNCCSAKATPVVEPLRDTSSGDIVVGQRLENNHQSHKVAPAPAQESVNDGSSLVFYERASREVTTNNLISMCKQGKLSIVMEMLEKEDVDVNMKGIFDSTPLISACQYNHESIVLTLLEVNGIDIHHANQKGGMALTFACLEGMQDAVEALVRMDAKPMPSEVILYNKQTDKNDYLAPLSAAVINGHGSIVSSLLNITGGNSCPCPVDHAFQQYSSMNTATTAKKIITKGVTCLMLACKYAHSDIVAMLLKEKATTSLIDSEDNNLLHYTCRSKGAEATLTILRDLNVFSPQLINAVDSRGDTPLHLCCDGKHVGAASILLAYLKSEEGQMRVRKDRQDDSTAQSMALSAVVHNIVTQAKTHVVTTQTQTQTQTPDPNQCPSSHFHFHYELHTVPLYQNILGKTPLHIAVKRRCVELIDLLLLHNFDPEIKDKAGISPWDMAKKLPKSSPILGKIETYLTKQTYNRANMAAESTARRQEEQQEIKNRQEQEEEEQSILPTPSSTCPLTPIKPRIIDKTYFKQLTLSAPPSRQELFSDKRKAKQQQQQQQQALEDNITTSATTISILAPPLCTEDKTPETESAFEEEEEDGDTTERAADTTCIRMPMLEPLTPAYTTPSKSNSKSNGFILSPEYTSGAKLNTAPIYSGSNYKAVTSAPKKNPAGSGSVSSYTSSSSRKASKSTVLHPPPLCQLSLSSRLEFAEE